MAPHDHLGELEALVLTAVVHAGRDANGVGVYRAIADRAGRDVSLPSIHVTLRRLEQKRLLRSTVAPASARGGRPRRYYTLTPAGARALEAFRAMWRRVWRGLHIPHPEGDR